MRLLEATARLREGAGIAVQALRGDEDAVLRLRRVGKQREREHGCSQQRWHARGHGRPRGFFVAGVRPEKYVQGCKKMGSSPIQDFTKCSWVRPAIPRMTA